MINAIDTTSIFTTTGSSIKTTVKHEQEINEVGSGNSTVEKETDSQSSFSIPVRRELTPEEQRRVEFLKTILVQTLTAAQGDPTDEQKKNIREAEAELEKITGVKMRSRISNVTDKITGEKDEDEERRKEEQLAQGMDPKEAIHNHLEIKGQSTNPGMQMLRNNAFLGSLQSLDLGKLASLGD